MIHKYLILINKNGFANSSDDIQNNIKNLPPKCTWCMSNTWALIETDKFYTPSELREKIIGDTTHSLCVFEISTNGHFSANGEFASKSNVDWFTKFLENEKEENNEIKSLSEIYI